MSIDYGNPPRNFIEEYRCEEPTAVMCDCGRAMVLVNGNDECPVCDAIPSAVHKDPKLYQAGTHPVFSGGNWMARVTAEVDACGFGGCLEHDGEPTKDIPVESMRQAVGL